MGLSFTHIKDQRGAAIYFIHDGTARGEIEFSQLKTETEKGCENQCVLLSARDNDGAEIIKFYNLHGSKFVLIVRDNDQLHHVWSDGERFDAQIITYTARQTG